MSNVKKTSQNRILILFGTILAQIGLGTIYTWSLFNQPIADKCGWQLSSVAVTFSITSFALSFSTLFAGKLEEKIGIRKLITLSGVILGGGLILTSKVNSIGMLYLTAGVIVGAADGIAYIISLTNCIKWFPEKKGLVSGLSIGAYGLGSLIFKYINSGIMSSKGVTMAFLCWGVIVFILVSGGAQFLKDAPNDDEEELKNNNSKLENFTPTQMLKKKEAYLLFVMMFTASMSGLYLIGMVKDIGVQLAGLTPVIAANAVAMVAISNTAGRIILGALSDKVGRLNVVLFGFTVTAVSVIIMATVSMNFGIFFACVAGIAFCFGGNITVFPAIVGEFFGFKNHTKNYGIIYQGFGLGALSGSFIASVAGGFKATFMVIGVMCIISIIIALTIKQPNTIAVEKAKIYRRREI